MDTSVFSYHLPRERIAQYPAVPKESAKLMTVCRTTGSLNHRTVNDLPDLVGKGDLVILNDTKVFKARLLGNLTTPEGQSCAAELFLIRPNNDGTWIALGKPGKKFTPGVSFHIPNKLKILVTGTASDGMFTVALAGRSTDMIGLANRLGHVPVPPYIKREPSLEEYQTSYATHGGSVAAPTAGFHLTRSVRERMEINGASFARITLHVGPGTFRPMKKKTIEEHLMHAEHISIPQHTAEAITKAKKEGRRVIAVGTTVARTLEGVASVTGGPMIPYRGDTDIFIRPGWNFRIIDGLLTNFHLPESTLLVLVSAFAGYENTMHAYREAVRMEYRFFSFGDAMLIS